MKLVPGTGSPPMPTHVVTPMPFSFSSFNAWYVSVPDRLTMPTGPPARATSAGMNPMLHSPGVNSPGQFGPRMRDAGKSRRSRL